MPPGSVEESMCASDASGDDQVLNCQSMMGCMIMEKLRTVASSPIILVRCLVVMDEYWQVSQHGSRLRSVWHCFPGELVSMKYMWMRAFGDPMLMYCHRRAV